jgi:hypothetical protein
MHVEHHKRNEVSLYKMEPVSWKLGLGKLSTISATDGWISKEDFFRRSEQKLGLSQKPIFCAWFERSDASRMDVTCGHIVLPSGLSCIDIYNNRNIEIYSNRTSDIYSNIIIEIYSNITIDIYNIITTEMYSNLTMEIYSNRMLVTA